MPDNNDAHPPGATGVLADWVRTHIPQSAEPPKPDSPERLLWTQIVLTLTEHPNADVKTLAYQALRDIQAPNEPKLVNVTTSASVAEAGPWTPIPGFPNAVGRSVARWGTDNGTVVRGWLAVVMRQLSSDGKDVWRYRTGWDRDWFTVSSQQDGMRTTDYLLNRRYNVRLAEGPLDEPQNTRELSPLERGISYARNHPDVCVLFVTNNEQHLAGVWEGLPGLLASGAYRRLSSRALLIACASNPAQPSRLDFLTCDCNPAYLNGLAVDLVVLLAQPPPELYVRLRERAGYDRIIRGPGVMPECPRCRGSGRQPRFPLAMQSAANPPEPCRRCLGNGWLSEQQQQVDDGFIDVPNEE